MFCPNHNVCSAYYLRTNQLKLKNLDLDVPLLFLYPYLGKPNKYHQHITHISLSTACGISLIYIKKSSGSNIEPCGTPHVIDALSEHAFFILTINILFQRYDVYHLIASSVKPRKGFFQTKIKSNAFCKSIRIIPVRKPNQNLLRFCHEGVTKKSLLSEIF